MGFWSLGTLRQPKAQDIKWRKSPRGEYYRLFMIDDFSELKLDNVGGVYLLWHGGIKPSWLVAGVASASLKFFEHSPRARNRKMSD